MSSLPDNCQIIASKIPPSISQPRHDAFVANHITIPTADQLTAQIKACEQELSALKRLRRMAQAAETAAEARLKRQAGVNPTSQEDARDIK